MIPKYKKSQRLKSIHDHINTHYWVEDFDFKTGDYFLRIHPHHPFTVTSDRDTVENHMVPDDSFDRDRY